ncbi:MAG: hypothetical protein FWF20_07760 [Betaproteobacteria bacterium]|nr:hypothetical protein [Betaproteobacteria bacterium]MCL2886659.1 hypothetical protein [Betaproteobacteria bacterium]
MKAARILAALFCLVAVASSGIDEAQARGRGGHGHSHGHSSVRVGIGVGFGGFWGPGWGYYSSPWYASPWYSPVIVAAPGPAPVYIEQSPPPRSAQPASNATPPGGAFWYYCRNPAGYYPYVNECREAWLKVRPQ